MTTTRLRLRIRDLRESKGWSQETLARRAGIATITVLRLENVQTTRIDLATIDRLATALDVAPGFLLTREPPPRLTPQERRRRQR